MKLMINITDEQKERLVALANRRGFLREDPYKRWNEKDTREAVVHAITKLIQDVRP